MVFNDDAQNIFSGYDRNDYLKSISAIVNEAPDLFEALRNDRFD